MYTLPPLRKLFFAGLALAAAWAPAAIAAAPGSTEETRPALVASVAVADEPCSHPAHLLMHASTLQ